MLLSIILGTRPEIIKMSPIIRELQNNNIDFFILHTGQHYSFNLDKIFFEELELPLPKYNLDVGSGSHAEEIGKMMIGIEKILQKEKVDLTFVEGDTNTVLSGALVSSKLHIKIGHIEAGLRSYDRMMPEEINRIITDHISDYLFAPTNTAKKNLLKEGLHNNIFITGNTIVDAVHQNLEIAKSKSKILDKLNITKNKYILVTFHRQENVDIKEKLENILYGLKQIYHLYDIPIICPLHPRTKKRITEFCLDFPNEIHFIEPVGFLDFLQLESNAKIIITDSGGVQEEACILKVPCITLRENTERPETLKINANVLSGTNPDMMIKCMDLILTQKNNWIVPFGDGKTGKKIIQIIDKE